MASEPTIYLIQARDAKRYRNGLLYHLRRHGDVSFVGASANALGLRSAEFVNRFSKMSLIDACGELQRERSIALLWEEKHDRSWQAAELLRARCGAKIAEVRIRRSYIRLSGIRLEVADVHDLALPSIPGLTDRKRP